MTATRSKSMMLGGKRLDYAVRVSPTAKRARIRVNPAGVVVFVPKQAESGRAAAFLLENEAWVTSQVKFITRTGSIRTTPRRRANSATMLRGRPVTVVVVQEESRRRSAAVEHTGDQITVRVPQGRAVDPHRTLESWLRRQAKRDIHERLGARSREMKRKPGKVFIMGQRTKWGNCSSRRNISINWRLVMAPPEVLDYVVVHELAHLIEPYHSAKFWLVVASWCPEFQRAKDWLATCGHTVFSSGLATDQKVRIGLGVER
jgi:predicted metal-dependent hydrolase